MVRRLLLGAALAILLVGSPDVVAEGAPRLRIVTSTGRAPSTLRVMFGGSAVLFAVSADEDDLRPDRAVRGVEWRVFRTGGPDAVREEDPGMKVGHRLPARRWWGHPARPFVCPEELRLPWASGRYVVRASHPDFGDATLRITVTSIVLVGHRAELGPDSYEASFVIAVTDPDLRDDRVPVDVVVVDEQGRSVDRLTGAVLFRDGAAHLTPRPVAVSSRVPASVAAERGNVTTASRWPPLRVVPDSRLRIGVTGRWFEFPLPLEEGALIRRNSSPPSGRESAMLASRGRLLRGGDHGRTGRKGSGRLDRNPRAPRTDPAGSAGGGARTPDHRSEPGEIQIASSAGRGRRLKVWMGETITFAARLRPTGLEDVFRSTPWLRDVWWTLIRVNAAADRPPDAILSGASVTEVARVSPHGLWGDPPSTLICPDDVGGGWRPGRYRVRAERPDGGVAEIRMDVASFEIADVLADLKPDGYQASLRFRVKDPTETRDRVPLSVRIVSPQDEILDEALRVSLGRNSSRRHQLVSGRVLVSSTAKRACRDGHRDGETHPGRPCTLQAKPASSLQIVLDDAVFTYPLPLSTALPVTGGSTNAGR